jgi:transposase
LRDWLASERGVTVSLGCLWRTLDRLGLRLKKVASCRRAEPAGRGGGPRGLVRQPGGSEPSSSHLPRRDWIATNMIRRYGRSPRGERLVGVVPYGHWKTTTFVAGPRCDGLTAPFVIDGPINGEWFEKVLAPTLRPGDIVILDNLGAHKVAGVRAAVEARGARLLYLPPYSPDLNPIEQLFASSRRSCARPPPELSRPSGQPSPPCSPPSAPMNAQITSPTQVIDAHRESALVFRFRRRAMPQGDSELRQPHSDQ